jgi:hypothetical protein
LEREERIALLAPFCRAAAIVIGSLYVRIT